MLESRGVLSKFSSTEELQSWNVTQFDGPWSKMEYFCSLRDIPTPVAAVLNEDRIAVIVAVLTELTLKLHTGTKVAMRWFLARATKLWLDGTSVSLLVHFQFLYALPFWAKQLLTSSGKKRSYFIGSTFTFCDQSNQFIEGKLSVVNVFGRSNFGCQLKFRFFKWTISTVPLVLKFVHQLNPLLN